mmetsp:Transcript_36638/g.77303  ORF Transcript_36638/g.77303 Transcript_36638/m.77303 type:complete len:1032 (-) Transcript_36638:196-3291(-)
MNNNTSPGPTGHSPLLRLRSSSLIGRSAEESILLNSYFASLSMGQSNVASVILIQGESGLGKTKLAETLRSHVEEDNGYFIQGKFDQLSYGSANRPYAGIASAFAEYCSAVEQRSQETRNEVAEKLRQETNGGEGRLLFGAIPSLRKLVECPHSNDAMHLSHSCDACQYLYEDEGMMRDNLESFSKSEGGSHRLNYLIKRVVSTISSIGDPIVILIDDIQWANKTEMDALKAMMVGAMNPFMFIFTCRPGDHPFLKVTEEFEGKTEIALQCLSRNSVRELVADMLKIDNPNECTSLANFVSRVSHGNPFFIRQQIISLRDDGLLRFGDNGWVWDVNEIDAIHDEILDDVVIMLSQKMKRLPSLTQEALKICASIGSKTDLFILGLLIRHMHAVADGSDPEDNESLARTAISVSSQEGLLSVTRNGKGVTFTHDSVNEAAYSLLEPEEQASHHLKLGKILHSTVCSTVMQKYLYTIASQLSHGIELITDEEDRIATTRIFLSAGEKSMEASAFPEAHFFFTKGIYLLHDEDWVRNYRLCCDIYTKAADTAALTTDFEDMNKCLAVLFNNCKGSIVDCLNASYIQVRTMMSRDDPEALDTGLEALRLAGEKFPSQNLAAHTVTGFAWTRCSKRIKSAEKLLELPQIADKQIIATIRLIDLLVPIALSYLQALAPLLCFRVVKLNLAYGLSRSMPSAVALYGVILGRFGYPLTETAKYGEIAFALQKELKCDVSAHVTLLTYGITFTRTKKLSDCIKPLQSGYESGVKTGELTHAMSCAAVLGWCSFFSGQQLRKVASTLKKLRTTILEYNMTTNLRGNRNYQKAVDYCLGVSKSASFCLSTDPDEHSNVWVIEQAKFIQLAVACIFGDHQYAWAMSEKLQKFGATSAGTIWPYICAFYRGMAAASMLQLSRGREYVRTVKVCLKILRKGQHKSVCNILHQLYLLEAEYAAFRRKHSSAEKFYLLSIKHAENFEVTHEHAFACEKFGTFHLLRKNHSAAYEQIRVAHRLYLTWGSRPKCEILEKKYPRLGENEQ